MNRKKKKMLMRATVLLSVGIVGYLGMRAIEVQTIAMDLNQKIQSAEGELEEERLKLEELQAEREDMDSPEYIERMARQKLGMVKRDDIVFRER